MKTADEIFLCIKLLVMILLTIFSGLVVFLASKPEILQAFSEHFSL